MRASSPIYDTATHDLRVTRVAGDRPAGKDHELWLVGADGQAGLALGVIGAAGPKAPAVAEGLRAQLNEGAVLAVSLEEEGGWVTGVPAEVLGVGTVKVPEARRTRLILEPHGRAGFFFFFIKKKKKKKKTSR